MNKDSEITTEMNMDTNSVLPERDPSFSEKVTSDEELRILTKQVNLQAHQTRSYNSGTVRVSIF